MVKAMKKAFTLIELTVSIALLVMMLSFALIIFRVSIDAYRVAGANTEIMQKMRTITEQLNRDFRGLRKDAPLLIWFQQDNTDVNEPDRFDQIMFFADGDFQSTQLYFINPAVPLRGNVARIFYGQARVSQQGFGYLLPWQQREENRLPEKILNERSRILARRQHILSADPALDIWPNPLDVRGSFDDDSSREDAYRKNELYEHDSLSLTKWKTLTDADNFNEPALGMNGTIADRCFEWRPSIDFNNHETFHKLMCEGVGSFAVQFIYTDTNDPLKTYDDQFRWFPSNDPNQDGTKRGSHFGLITAMGNPAAEFGVYFNIPHSSLLPPPLAQPLQWYPIENAVYKYVDSDPLKWKTFNPNFYPKALKFTFRLYDSKGIIKEYRNGVERKGRTFTHIVYLKD